MNAYMCRFMPAGHLQGSSPLVSLAPREVFVDVDTVLQQEKTCFQWDRTDECSKEGGGGLVLA